MAGVRTRDLVFATLAREAAGLGVWGALSGLWWLVFGEWPGLASSALTALLFAVGPVGEYYRSDPPQRRRGVAAGVLVMVAAFVLVEAALDVLLPALADGDLDMAPGLLVSVPLGVAAFARVAGRARSLKPEA